MKDFEKYVAELSALSHKSHFSSHIMEKNDFGDFVGFSEREIWGVAGCDLERYENWIKEQ